VSADLVCAAAGCENIVVRSRRPGRPAIYCSADCRPSPIAGPRYPAVAIEVVQDDQGDDGGSQAGRNWIVRLQRGHETVTIGQDLGRFSAQALAGDLRRLLGPARQGGGAIE
jgi:hypothetical protein